MRSATPVLTGLVAGELIPNVGRLEGRGGMPDDERAEVLPQSWEDYALAH
jgi:hypothetical protein